MNILVFKTSVDTRQEVSFLSRFLNEVAGAGQWNFDLDDCDRILRILPGRATSTAVIQLLDTHGFACAELEEVQWDAVMKSTIGMISI